MSGLLSQGAIPGKAASLQANEQTSTPNVAPKPPARSKGQGPASGTLSSFKGNPSQPVKRYAPAYKGEKPAGFEPLPQGKGNPTGRAVRPFYQTPVDKRSGLERAVDRQVTPLLAKGSKVASPAVTIPATVAGDVLANLGGGPSVLAAAHAIQHHNAVQAGIELAGILPVGRFGKALRAIKEGAEVAVPADALFHGSPEGELANIDALYHTKAWREGPGFYATSSPEKAAKYAAGKTAKGERLNGNGAVNVVRLKPGTKVLNMDAQPAGFWMKLAEQLTGDKVDPKVYADWAKDIRPQDARGASVGILNRLRLMHYLTGYEDMPQTDAYYAIEEALHDRGIQATLHHENGVPVHIIKDASAIERHGVLVPPAPAITRHPETYTGSRSAEIEQLIHETPTPTGKIKGQSPSVSTRDVGANGGGNGKLPPTKNGSTPPPIEPGKSGASIVRGAMKGAKADRRKLDILHSQERSARASKLHAIYTDTSLPVAERERRASMALRGELPKLDTGNGPQELTPEVLNSLKAHVMEHEFLPAYSKKRTVGALNKLALGETLQNNEINLLGHVFGKEAAAALRSGDKLSAWEHFLRVVNIPRSLEASFDVSAPMRQGLVAMTRHPIISGRNIGPMFKALKNEDNYQNLISEIQSRPTYPLMQEAKLAITKLGSEVGPREERFPTDLAEKIPVLGRGVRGSGRAYTGYLDKTRADIFDHLLQRKLQQGGDIHDEKFLKGLGSLVNNMTGRGDLGGGAIHEAGKFLNAFFFSPRLLASRVNIIAAPVKYARADPFVRREALKTWFSLAGTLTTVLGALSQIPGVKVETDPRNPDWGKVRYGNTRVDLAGGFQQPLRLAAQIATSTAISSTTGKKMNLTATGFGQPTRLDLVLRFFEGKEAPAPSILTDWLRNSNQVGQKFTWKSEAGQKLIPLLWQDVSDLYNSRHGGVDGVTAAFLGYGIGSTGVGLQTYGPKPKTPRVTGGGPGILGNGAGSSSSGGGLLSSGG